MNFNEPGRMRYPVTTLAVCDASPVLPPSGAAPGRLLSRDSCRCGGGGIEKTRRQLSLSAPMRWPTDWAGDNGRSIHDQEASVRPFVRSFFLG